MNKRTRVLKAALKSHVLSLPASEQESNMKTIRICLQWSVEPVTISAQKAWKTYVTGRQYEVFRYGRRLKAATDLNTHFTLKAFVTYQVNRKSKFLVI